MPTYTLPELPAQLDLFEQYDDVSVRELVNRYIENIERFRVPAFFDTRHLAASLGYKVDFLYSVSNDPVKFYRTFSIKKKSGGKRLVSEPLPELKRLQRLILIDVLGGAETAISARAFKRNNTLRGNALIHRGKKYLFSFDITDFFDNIRSHIVYDYFYGLGYTEQIASLLTGLCTLNGSLPQGAPTSPILSNLIMKEFDEELFKFARERGINYTRYADDMTFSSEKFDFDVVIKAVRSKLKSLGLKLNKKKTRVQRDGSSKVVTGIVVNEILNVEKGFRHLLRQEIYYIKKYGLNGHVRYTNISHANYVDHLIGKSTYAYHITKKEIYKEYTNYLRDLKALL